MSKYLTITGADNLRISAAGHPLREQALQKTRKIVSVTDEYTQQQAILAVGVAKGLLKEVETSRKEVKAPLLTWGREIDETAVNFCAPLRQEANRIELLIAGFQKRERERVDAENKLRAAQLQKEQEELARIERAKFEANQKAWLANTQAEREAAQKAQAELAQQQAAFEIESGEAASNEVIKATQATGASVRKTFDFVVFDLTALFNSHPECVKLEAKKSAIKNAIDIQVLQGKTPSIPGVKISEVTKVAVRSIPTGLMLGN